MSEAGTMSSQFSRDQVRMKDPSARWLMTCWRRSFWEIVAILLPSEYVPHMKLYSLLLITLTMQRYCILTFQMLILLILYSLLLASCHSFHLCRRRGFVQQLQELLPVSQRCHEQQLWSLQRIHSQWHVDRLVSIFYLLSWQFQTSALSLLWRSWSHVCRARR